MSVHIKPYPAGCSRLQAHAHAIRWLLLTGVMVAGFIRPLCSAQAQVSGDDLRLSGAAFADPNTPAFGLAYRGSVRAQLGAALPLWVSPDQFGAIVMLNPFLELHEPEHSPQVLPSEYWRARVSLAGGLFWAGDQTLYLIALALEHESDHETAHAYSQPGFLAQNALALPMLGNFQLGELLLRVAPILRLYVLSCTRDRSTCKNFAGDSAFGAQLDVALEAPGFALVELVPFVSASGFGILSHAAVRGESHLEAHLGLLHTSRFLLMQLYAIGYFGNDVGITRADRVVQFGIGTRLSL
jgi:hypothetical protein